MWCRSERVVRRGWSALSIIWAWRSAEDRQQGFAQRLMLPVSNDTLLRVVRRRTVMPSDPLIVVGIDDWAFRRNHRYGTIVCDLERRRIVALLPNRETVCVPKTSSGLLT
jgi:hypothetical protein